MSQKDKTKFRATVKWKKFRLKIASVNNKLDYITKKKLIKGYTLHHLDLNEENYQNLIDENFIPLNKNTHKFIHWLYLYYKNDKLIIERINDVMEKMLKLENQ